MRKNTIKQTIKGKTMNLNKYVSPKVTVNVPSNFEFEVSDYHEFDHIQYILKTSVGLDYSFEEVGCDGKYHAVFWIGDKPTELIDVTKKSFED